MFPKQKPPSPGGFTGKFYQGFRVEIIPVLYNSFQKIESKELLPNSFKASTDLLPNQTKT